MTSGYEWQTYTPGYYTTTTTGPPAPVPAGAEPTTAWTSMARSTPGVGQYGTHGGVIGVIAGLLYAAGGVASDGTNATADLRRYDPATNTWTALAAMPAARYAAGGAVIAGKLYVAGGAATLTGTSTATLYRYDPTTNTWTTLTAMPAATASWAGVAAHGGYLYVAGGGSTAANAGTPVATLYRYDPTANTWTTLAAMPTARRRHELTRVGAKLYVTGGAAVSGTAYDTAFLSYDPATNTWATAGALPQARGQHGAVAHGYRLYVLRGAPTAAAAVVDYWDSLSNTWATLSPAHPGTAGAWIERAGVIGDTLYVPGTTSALGYTHALATAADAPETPVTTPVTVTTYHPPTWDTDPDRTAGLMSWTLTYGRTDSTVKVAPTTATVALAGALAAPCPVAGERFRLALSDDLADDLGLDETERVRFTGETTDAVIDPHRPVSDVYTVTGVGKLGRLRRRLIDLRWSAAVAGTRVAKILDAAGAVAADLGTLDPGTRTLLAPARAQSAGQLLDQTSDSTGGQLVEQRTGVLDWHDAEHRRGVPSTLTLSAAEILNDLTFEQHVTDLVNTLAVSYGTAGASTVTVTDPASVTERDAYAGSLSTVLATAVDAYDVGIELVGRRADPVWQLPNLVVDLRAVATDAKRGQLLALAYGDRITVTGLPAGSPYGTSGDLFVEGVTETATAKRTGTVWRLSIAVSDPLLSGVSVRWSDLPTPLLWSAVRADLTWLDLARIDDPNDLD